MAKFRYYITDLYDGSIKGTNEESVARGCAVSEDYFVVDTKDGTWLQGDTTDEVHGVGIQDFTNPSDVKENENDNG